MTHSAQRLATKEELKKDYVIFVRPAGGIDDVDEAARAETLRKTKELADIAYTYEPANIGRTGANCTAQGDAYDDIMSHKKLNGFMMFLQTKKRPLPC
jgi:hypothetical protein